MFDLQEKYRLIFGEAEFFKTATYQNKSLPVHKMVFQHYQKSAKHNTKITVSNMFTISILMPETFQVRVPVSVPRK